MIDIELINNPVKTTSFDIIDINQYPILFLGFIIKNEYDNKRIQLNEKYSPINLLHISKDKKTVIAMKGVKLTPNQNIKNIFNAIKKQEALLMNLVTYENLLNQYNLFCKETYSYFSLGLYPVDFENLKSVCEDSFNQDKKIFQHLLGLEEKVFDFQKFSSLKLFILTV
jgi:hypothetical protein